MWPHASSCHNRIGDDDDDDDDEKSEIISAGDLWYASIVRIYQSIFKLPATVLVMQLKEFSLNISQVHCLKLLQTSPPSNIPVVLLLFG